MHTRSPAPQQSARKRSRASNSTQPPTYPCSEEANIQGRDFIQLNNFMQGEEELHLCRGESTDSHFVRVWVTARLPTHRGWQSKQRSAQPYIHVPSVGDVTARD